MSRQRSWIQRSPGSQTSLFGKLTPKPVLESPSQRPFHILRGFPHEGMRLSFGLEDQGLPRYSASATVPARSDHCVGAGHARVTHGWIFWNSKCAVPRGLRLGIVSRGCTAGRAFWCLGHSVACTASGPLAGEGLGGADLPHTTFPHAGPCHQATSLSLGGLRFSVP